MQVQPYVFFEGRCAEAIAFYQETVGAKVQMLMHFSDAPDPSMNKPENADKIMHASLRIGETTVLVSDGHASGSPAFSGFGLSLSAGSDAEAERIFTALGVGGAVRMAMDKTFFASRFGMVADRFGVLWMIMTGAT